MKEYKHPICTNVIESRFGSFAVIKQSIDLLECSELTSEVRGVYYPLLADTNKPQINDINFHLNSYFISRTISLNPIVNEAEESIFHEYFNRTHNISFNYLKDLSNLQILKNTQGEPLLYKNKYRQYVKYKMLNVKSEIGSLEYLSLASRYDYDLRESDINNQYKEFINYEIISLDEQDTIEKLSIKELLCYSSIIYITDVEQLKTRNNSKYHNIKGTYARGILKDNELIIKHFGKEKSINIFYDYNFNCVVWNKIHGHNDYSLDNIISTNISIGKALKNNVIKSGSLLSGTIVKKKVEGYKIGDSIHAMYTTPVLWDSIFYDYQDRDERLSLIFSLANRKILPDAEIQYDNSDSDYEPYTRDDAFDDAFGGEDEAYWNID
ncbi:hypothetical protein [Hymenobacter sp.]|jgi:hypothetical protein|uniref:hypothetical protein n=1 Tax=Hymenobacter sp. TaxID=1898978 RepID=UPI002EDAEF2D